MLVAAMLTAALAAHSPPKAKAVPEEPAGPSVIATDVEVAAIRKALDDQLNDAESARLKDFVIRHHGKDRGGYACGKVNAKNRYGAYVGYEILYADLFDFQDQGVKAIVWAIDPDLSATMCKKRHLVPGTPD